jgi:hypothetical protein
MSGMPQYADKPASLEGQWRFGSDVPTYDFLKYYDGTPMRLGEALDGIVFYLEKDHFLQWEAVVCRELGLPLTVRQENALASPIGSKERPGEQRVLYIDDIPRPRQTWSEFVRRIAPRFALGTFRTFEVYEETMLEGWPRLSEAVERHAGGLSLPVGCSEPLEVIPAELRHRLWLQTCLDELCGLGQEEELTLTSEQEQDRLDWLIEALRKHKGSMAFLGLTLTQLLKSLELPARDTPVFIRLMQEKLGLPSTDARIADYL